MVAWQSRWYGVNYMLYVKGDPHDSSRPKKIISIHSTILLPLYLMIPHSQVDHLRLQSDTIYVQTIQIIQGIFGVVQACWINWILAKILDPLKNSGKQYR